MKIELCFFLFLIHQKQINTMKKLKSIALMTLFVSASLFFTSCESDSSDENESSNSTGDYWPTAIGNQWILDQNGTETSMKIIASQKVNGDTYFKFDQFAGAGGGAEGTATAWIKKVNGDYYIKMDDVVYDYGEYTGKMTGYEFVFFKDYLEVNKTWTGNYSQETSFNIPNFPKVKTNVTYTGTILEKGASVTVKNVTYKDVVKFKFRLEAKVEGGDGVTASDVEYWIAKDIGVIKMTMGSTVSQLVTYTLK